ncbi:hypothetical protein QTL97_09470 [Sporosarcina thermotolerans]|uniref:DUF4149 domain-containing protein n=1 Tax=Sporosarcina thermotolerans TaxID=633404 RepID=A0AAW9A9V0_9BACL|nr:hypothetical protein [Sporosarcina thermotolerans]MDW0117165.1 hypothetical protein [Sporosarcina thermotolerans]WHT47337.1 hypothetical protein QNH10_14145 [Sporosarcina thermotolerans]
MFQPTALFQSGLKIIGVLTIIWGLTHVVTVVYSFYSILNLSELMSNSDLTNYRLSLIFQAFYPVLLLALGIYLLKSGEAIIQFAFRGSGEKYEAKTGELFMLFMKLAGLVLIIYSIPKAFQLVANVMFVSSAKLIDTTGQTEFIIHNLIITVIQLLLGVYLLKSGKVFYKMGFK